MRVQDQIAALGQQINVTPQDFAQAALDSIAFVGLADHLADGKPDTRSGHG